MTLDAKLAVVKYCNLVLQIPLVELLITLHGHASVESHESDSHGSIESYFSCLLKCILHFIVSLSNAVVL